jgi:hypothetical protein
MPDRLTQQFVADLDADGRDRLIFDERLPGFGIRVTAAGAKIFVAQAPAGGRLHRVAVAGSRTNRSWKRARRRAAIRDQGS